MSCQGNYDKKRYEEVAKRLTVLLDLKQPIVDNSSEEEVSNPPKKKATQEEEKNQRHQGDTVDT